MLERLTQTDHAAAVQIVQRYLNADQLQALLDKHVQHIVTLTEQAHGRSSPYVGADLAAFLIDLHGIDLLRNRLIRVYLTHSLPADQIAHLANWGGEVVPPTLFLQVKQIANRRWVSGKQ